MSYEELLMDGGLNAPSVSKVPVILCLDTSGSMAGDNKINVLNESVQTFIRECANDSDLKDSLEVSVITFSSQAETKIAFTPIKNILEQDLLLKASGSTNLVDALKISIESLAERKKLYKDEGIPYFQPWLILMTDGELDGGISEEYQKIAAEVKELSTSDSLVVNPIAFGSDAEEAGQALKLLHKSEVYFHISQIEKFKQYFEWLKQSTKAVSQSKTGDTLTLTDPSKLGIFELKL